MRIAILGTRGIPASYGGFETFAEHLARRLVLRGHDVTVYCRAHYVSPRQLEYHGVKLKVLPTIRHKYFDTVPAVKTPPSFDKEAPQFTGRSKPSGPEPVLDAPKRKMVPAKKTVAAEPAPQAPQIYKVEAIRAAKRTEEAVH